MRSRPSLCLLLALTAGCRREEKPADSVDSAPRPEVPAESCPDQSGLGLADAPRTVVLLTVDTVNVSFLGKHEHGWDVTPNIDAFLAQSAVFRRTQVPRGLSEPSLASYLTGAYPRTHGVRENRDDLLIAPDVASLFSRFKEAGYTTAGMTANMCQLVDKDVDRKVCTEEAGGGGADQSANDAALVDAASTLLLTAKPDQPLFLWVHFMDPHDPFDAREPWYSQFHPKLYKGPFEDPTAGDIEDATMGRIPITDEDRLQIDAIYASQVAKTDARIGEVLAALDKAGRSDAVVALGFDHGEELARRTTYFYHGCSVYDLVTGVTTAVRAPGRVAAGETFGAWISSTSIAPTLVELAGLPWSGPAEGVSLVDNLQRCVEFNQDVYGERGVDAVVLLRDNWKYILDPAEGDPTCRYNSSEYAYPGTLRSLYDLGSDPDEASNLAEVETETAGELERAACRWVLGSVWESAEADAKNGLIRACTR